MIKLWVCLCSLVNLCFYLIFYMLKFNSLKEFLEGITSQFQIHSKPLGISTISVTSWVYLALFQRLKFCELGRHFLQTSSLREFELMPKSLTKNQAKARFHIPRVISRSMWPGSRDPTLKGVNSRGFQNFRSSKLWDVKFHDSQSYPNYQSNKSHRWLKNLIVEMDASHLSGG